MLQRMHPNPAGGLGTSKIGQSARRFCVSEQHASLYILQPDNALIPEAGLGYLIRRQIIFGAVPGEQAALLKAR